MIVAWHNYKLLVIVHKITQFNRNIIVISVILIWHQSNFENKRENKVRWRRNTGGAICGPGRAMPQKKKLQWCETTIIPPFFGT
jgi:hypothetical protein